MILTLFSQEQFQRSPGKCRGRPVWPNHTGHFPVLYGSVSTHRNSCSPLAGSFLFLFFFCDLRPASYARTWCRPCPVPLCTEPRFCGRRCRSRERAPRPCGPPPPSHHHCGRPAPRRRRRRPRELVVVVTAGGGRLERAARLLHLAVLQLSSSPPCSAVGRSPLARPPSQGGG